MSCTSCQNFTVEAFDANSPDPSRWESQWRGNWAELDAKDASKSDGCAQQQTSKCLYNAQGEFVCDKNIPGVPNEYMVQRPLYEKNIGQYAGKN